MNSLGQDAYIQWAEEQSRLLDGPDSDSESAGSSSPLVLKHQAPPVMQRGNPSSPRRNGMLLDANIRSLFSMTTACSPQSRHRSPDKSSTPNRKTQSITGRGQQLIPPSLSGLSLQSASTETSWQSPSSTSSRKHSLELHLDGSPQPKRRLLAEMNNAASSFRYSAPCVQSSLDSDGSERPRGFLRRSGAPIQSYIPAPQKRSPAPLPTSYLGLEWEREKVAGGSEQLDPRNARLQPHCRVNATPVPREQPEQRDVRKIKGYSFWRLTTPPIIESAVRESNEAEDVPAGNEPPLSGPRSSACSACTNLNRPDAAARPSSSLDPGPAVSENSPQDAGSARLSALQALEGIAHQERSSDEGQDNQKTNHFDEKNPITMCGGRLYSDWTGHWDGVPRKIPGAGALFPEGYLPRAGDPEPWVCPVRDCQTIFPEAWALGGHFSARHRACLLNDNLDGTMTVVGKRKTADPTSGRMPPVVVSRDPIDAATAPPKAPPRRPGRRRKAETAQMNGPTSEPMSEVNGVDGKQLPVADSYSTSNIQRLSSSLFPFRNPVKDSQPESRRASRPLTQVGTTEPTPPVKEEPLNSRLWRYLMVYLPADTRLPNSTHVLELLPLRRQRDLPHRWKFQLAGGHPTLKTLCAVLVYLTGTRQSLRCGICTSLDNEDGVGPGASSATILPFPDCITLPATASVELEQYFGEAACCNSFYQSAEGGQRPGGHCVSRFSLSPSDLGGSRSVAESVVRTTTPAVAPSPCPEPAEDGDGNDSGDSSDSDASIVFSPATVRSSLGYKTALPARVAGRPKVVSIKKTTRPAANTKTKRQSSIRRLAARLGAKAARREVAVYKPSEGVVEEGEETEKASSITTEGSHGTRRSRRLLEQQRDQSRPESKQSSISKASTSVGSTPKSSKLRKNQSKESSGSPDSNKTGLAASRPESQGKPDAAPSLSLMMADWEIAPGRIRMGSGENADNVAFSSSYLAQGRAVPVADGTTFQMIEIQAGASLRWPADDSKTRLCSVARGIIRVKLAEKEFPIGPNGMWKVTQGVVCNVVNPFYLGAVIHVTTIDEGVY